MISEARTSDVKKVSINPFAIKWPCAGSICFMGAVGAFTLPVNTSLFLFAPALVASSSFFLLGFSAYLYISIPIAALLILSGVAAAPFLTACCACAALLSSGRPGSRTLAATIVLLHLSFTATLEALLSGGMGRLGIEAAGPALIAAFGLLAVEFPRVSSCSKVVLAAVATIIVTFLSRTFMFGPTTEMALAAGPIMVAAAFVKPAHPHRSVFIHAGLLAFILSWVLTPPRPLFVKDFHLLMPMAHEAPEAVHFLKLAEALDGLGLKVVVASNLYDIPERAMVLLPWLSVPQAKYEDEFTAKFRELANTRAWTVILFGEHTGYGRVDERVRRLTGYDALQRDTSVPPGNQDTTGRLRVADMLDWPAKAILNRGATTNVTSLRSRVLLSGDGWWSEPDLREWLWTGDYRWREGDKAGRISLAHAVRSPQGANWVIVGDSSPILTRQVVANIKPLLRIAELSTLMPAALSDLSLAIFLLTPSVTWRRRRALTALAALLGLLTMAGAIRMSPMSRFAAPDSWAGLYANEGGFEVTNFALQIARAPELLRAGFIFQRVSGFLPSGLAIPAVPTVTFALISDRATIGPVKLTDCRRLGNIDIVQEEVRLMDAQTCSIVGPARILLGSAQAAAAFEVKVENIRWIIVLDRGFLSESAPGSNSQWLLRVFENAQAK